MDKDRFSHEKRKDASRSRRALEHIGLKSIVLYNDLVQEREDIDITHRNATPHYQGGQLVSLTESGKELKVRGPELKNMAARKEEEQRITTSMKPDKGTYTITFNGKTTKALKFDADEDDIHDALDILGLGDIKVNGDLLGGMTLTFKGIFANKHQMEVKIDSSKLGYKGKTPLAIPPKVERIIPAYDYYIVQQEGGKQRYALVKEYPVGSGTFIPRIDFFFTGNFQIDKKKGSIIVQPTDGSPRKEIVLRQGFGDIK